MPVWRCIWTSRDFFVFSFLLHKEQGIRASWWTEWCSCSTSLRWNFLLQISQANLRSPVVHTTTVHLCNTMLLWFNPFLFSVRRLPLSQFYHIGLLLVTLYRQPINSPLHYDCMPDVNMCYSPSLTPCLAVQIRTHTLPIPKCLLPQFSHKIIFGYRTRLFFPWFITSKIGGLPTVMHKVKHNL
jgi:hypothetical protein